MNNIKINHDFVKTFLKSFKDEKQKKFCKACEDK